MYSYYRITTHEAQKDYPCDACEWVIPYFTEGHFTPEEELIIERAIFNECKIKKGTIYRKLVGIWDGEWVVFRSIPEIDDIALEYDFYPEI
jgi:hypothetical protein